MGPSLPHRSLALDRTCRFESQGECLRARNNIRMSIYRFACCGGRETINRDAGSYMVRSLNEQSCGSYFAAADSNYGVLDAFAFGGILPSLSNWRHCCWAWRRASGAAVGEYLILTPIGAGKCLCRS